MRHCSRSICFFFNDTATTEIYTLSLHDALPILLVSDKRRMPHAGTLHCHTRRNVQVPGYLVITRRHPRYFVQTRRLGNADRKSTRLNSSHQIISYPPFCLKKKITNLSVRTPDRG